MRSEQIVNRAHGWRLQIVVPYSSRTGYVVMGFSPTGLLVAPTWITLRLIQKPWIYGGQTKGLHNKTWKFLYGKLMTRAACLISFKQSFLPITEFISRNVVACIVEIPVEGGVQEIVCSPAYFPGDSDHVSKQCRSWWITANVTNGNWSSEGWQWCVRLWRGVCEFKPHREYHQSFSNYYITKWFLPMDHIESECSEVQISF